MTKLKHGVRALRGNAKGFPAHAALEERVDETDFLKIEEAQREGTVEERELWCDDGGRRVQLTGVAEVIAEEPSPNPLSRDPGQPGGLGDRVDPGPEKPV
jgi:hypothetical protein